MSEYQCQEPGCNFHIGIAGDLVTDQDLEQQDYYDQEIEEHYQMHKEQKQKKTESHPPQGGRWLKVDDQPLAGRLHGEVILVEFDSTVHVHVPLQLFDRGFELRFNRVGVGEQAVSLWGQDSAHACPPADRVSSGAEPHGLAFGQSLADDVLDRSDDEIVRSEDALSPEVSDNESSSHQISLSVGTPRGAVGSTPESTERGQTPTSSEKGKPSAVAPAEGDETKTSKQERCDFNA